MLLLSLAAAVLVESSSVRVLPPPAGVVDPCCREVAHAECWGFNPGGDSTASIQAAIDCPLAHTVVVANKSSPWIVAPPPLPDKVPCRHGSSCYRAALNFSSSNQLIIFEPGAIVEAKRWSFHGIKDCLAVIGHGQINSGLPPSGPPTGNSSVSGDAQQTWAQVRNVTIQGAGATWRMWKQDYQCYACPEPQPAGALPCKFCPKCDPKSKLYNSTECYAKSEWRHGLNLWSGVDITITGLTIDHSGGDGIQTGAGTEGGDRPGGIQPGTPTTRTRNVVIQNVDLSNNHRQGISVISADGLLVEDSIMRATNGTAPESGLDIEADNPRSILVDIVFRRCQFVDNNGCGVEMNIGNLDYDIDAPISILFEDCDVSWRDDYPFESPWYDGAGYMIASGKPGGSVTVRGGTVQGSAGAGIEIVNKHLSGPTVTFADVTLIDTARLDEGFSPAWIHAAPIMLSDGDGGLGGIWFENVKVVMGTARQQLHAATGYAARHFLSYIQTPCTEPPPCAWPCGGCPNVTGEIGGDIEVRWQRSEAQCTPVLLGDGGVTLANGSAFGHELLKNVSVGCTGGRYQSKWGN